MQANLGAGALCQLCLEPFGRLEDLKAPFVIKCGHVFCVGCLYDADPCCRICRITYDRHSYERLLALVGSIPRRPPSPVDAETAGQRLRDEIARINEWASVEVLQELYDGGRYFLDIQPRNRFKDLESSVRLLGCLLQTKDTLQAQVALANTFIERLHQLNSDKVSLQLQLEEMERRHAADRAFIRDHVADLLRRDP
ncbi:hypothetical protein BDZ97DRAFT_1290146 [Flammula alnicola]|nr:hypothetical protein BDZ97DRAFT_1290146 [Flammula alnicola]